MSITTITTEDLRHMEGKEGLILQGCGGDLKEWMDGINDMLTEAGILKDGSKFEDVSTFQYGELTCLLYPFEDVKLDIGKLAVWRLQTHADFGGTWLSDFVPNRLGGFIGEPSPEPEKPDCALIGQDGNVFNLIGIASRTLRRNGMAEQANGSFMNSMHLERLTWKPIRSARRYMTRNWCRQRMSMPPLPHRPDRYRAIMKQS